ncbi:component of IIS longevity pathway SMK-1-domain-containing protein [Blakeslea trispora]|nr:component of IIS longevity pathway SMK-1-domain-containing protein [Blakeslea trispora]
MLKDYVNKLVRLLQSIDPNDPIYQMDLQYMLDLLLALLALKDPQIVNTIIQDCNIYTVIQILESKEKDSKVNHRRQLRKAENAKKLVEFRNEAIEQKIRQAIRLKYIESLLNQFNCWGSTPYKLKEITGMLVSMYFVNCNEILEFIQSSGFFLNQLFGLAKEDIRKKEDVLKFVIELHAMSRHMFPDRKEALFKKMLNFGLNDVLIFCIESNDIYLSTNAATMIKKLRGMKLSQISRKRPHEDIEVTGNDKPRKGIRLEKDKTATASQSTASSSRKRSSRDAELEDVGRPPKGARLDQE